MTSKLVVFLAALIVGCAGSRAAEAPKADRVELRRQLARSLLARGEYVAASQPLLELMAMRPKDADVRVMLGTVYREQALYAEAEQEYRTALALQPKLAEAHAGLGLLREARGEAGEEALTDLKKAIELEPGQPSHYNNLGFALYTRGRYEEAAATYREALRRDPSLRRVRNNLGFTYGQLRQYQDALREFQLAQGAASAQNNLGLLLEQHGLTAEACSAFREAMRLDSELDQAPHNAARACGTNVAESLGRTP